MKAETQSRYSEKTIHSCRHLWTMEERIRRTRPSRSKPVENTEKDKIDPPILSVYFHTGEANTLIFIVDGGNAVGSIVMLSNVSWNMVVPFDSTTWRVNTVLRV